MPRYLPIGLAAWILGGLGCASRGNVEALEAQLRRQEDQIYAVQAQLSQSESELVLARKEVETLRVQLAGRGQPTLLPEQSQVLHRITGVRVQKYFSGGLNRDGQPGDDLLNVVVVPHDEDGESLKWPGEVEIEAIDLTAPESERRLGLWRFTTEEVAGHWQSGLTSGFQFRMPWQTLPASENIVLQARFRTMDGRQFGTSAEIRVTPNPEVVARAKSRRIAVSFGDDPKPNRASPPEPVPAAMPTLPNREGAAELKSPARLKLSPVVPASEAKSAPVSPAQADEFEQDLTWTQIDENPSRERQTESASGPAIEWQMSPGSERDRKPSGE